MFAQTKRTCEEAHVQAVSVQAAVLDVRDGDLVLSEPLLPGTTKGLM